MAVVPMGFSAFHFAIRFTESEELWSRLRPSWAGADLPADPTVGPEACNTRRQNFLRKTDLYL